MVGNMILVTNKLGLHARPANVFVTECNKCECDVYFIFNGKKVNAKSMLAVLLAGVGCGSEIELFCDGSDEQEALVRLTELLESGLPE